MTTLTDFLLARIAEDEAAAVCSDGPGCPNQDFEFSPGLTDCNQLSVGPNRWRAECEAKRRIVERAQRASQAFAQSINPTTSGVAMTLDLVLADLALPYADHPDYREEWRP